MLPPSKNKPVIPIIISGGSGSRLWPLSSNTRPKPFIKLADGHSLLQKSFIRANKIANVTEILTVTNQELYFHTQHEYREITSNLKTSYILEPAPRGTASAIAAAALHLSKSVDENTVLCIIPADHVIKDEEAFTQAINHACTLAEKNYVVTLGIKPETAETGYGYLEVGTEITGNSQSFHVQRFIEKPDAAHAQQYSQSGRHLWNSGIFVFNLKTILHEFKLNAFDLYDAVEKCLHHSEPHKSYLKLNSDFTKLPEISIDYCLMEKSANLVTVASDFGWNDVGSWKAMSEFVEPDNEGNRILGNALLHDTNNCYIHGSERLIGTVGVSNLAIIDTPDALLVLNRDHTQSVKQLVHDLKKQNIDGIESQREVHRPWGFYHVIGTGKGFKIKLIHVKPGESLSLQLHHHRHEHWVIVSGTALITKDENQFTVAANESTFIRAGEKHRLENPGTTDLIIVEVQCGDLLSETDIVRFEDRYDRIIKNKE